MGLILAIELRRQGVACALVERRAAPGHLPKGERCTARAMEGPRCIGMGADCAGTR